MKRTAIIVFLILSYFTVSTYAQQNKVDVSYVGNSGFLINIGDKKILIDALFKGFEGDYILPQKIQDKLINAKVPFDDVDLILVTHAHGDHVDLDMVKQYMQNNPKTVFASTQQLINVLTDSTNRWIGFNPTKEKPESKVIGDIKIEAFYLPHGPDSRIINNGFLITVNGISFFHTGDVDFDQFTFEEFQSLQLQERKIDLSFIQHFYLTSDSISRQFVTKGIGGKYIIPIHYHFTTPIFDSILIKQNYPEAILFNEELQTWHMPTKNDEKSTLGEYYFNQPPPGDSAVVFAPGIISLSNRLESNIVFNPDGKECYFGVLEIKDRQVSYKIYQSIFDNNKWTEQTEAPFSLNQNISDPLLSADGQKLYFNKEGDIWMINRISDGWSAAEKLPAPINSDAYEGNITESADGVIYISSRRPEGFGGIDNWRINRLPDQSLQAENLGLLMNSLYFDYSPFIAPDGSYLIFGSYRALRDGLLYISFNEGDDNWTIPINMNRCGAKVNNATAHHSNPSLSPDGKYLFFRRHEADTVMDVYWVSAEILKPLKEKALQEYSSQKLTHLKGDYLGQTPPGNIPEVFAPGIVSIASTIEHGSPTFSPDGNEVFWQVNSANQKTILCLTMRREKNVWTAPKISPYDSSPVFSPDGYRLYYLPFGEENGEKDGPHFVEKEGESWSSPVCMDLIKRFPEIKAVYNHSFTNSGTLYFLGHAEGYWNNFAIYRSELIDGEYAQPELLPGSINIPGEIRNWTPFIAPDESYLLFSSSRAKDKNDTGDIYISFRNVDGDWTSPVSLGEEVNSERPERFPSVTPDGKYLFFSRFVSKYNEDVMWVSAEIIDELKVKNNKK
ncbi:MBL fold metallo-hydrolase [Lentimicrobium sp. S6]|uniref:MBL fold metallo-hydrolase n=1 Tax=Lentimicrobium sp. S6 TaxID=2735872 RepID=UPI001556AA43|nr:MBL fold metallo-hydrolase [Lentimicrobium sp. S6]NPD46630.1 MBL fold metallo-hydrolase [Lentimicrobium sp. S6]